MGEKIIHGLPVKAINDIFRQLHSRHHTDWIWESAERLTSTIIRWVRTEGDERYEGISSLFGAELNREAREKGILRFHFPPLLVPILKDPRRFARLRTHFMIELSGKYAVTLYELLESVANKDTPELKASVEELRQWLKVPEGKLTRWPDFLRRALHPAVNQINAHSGGAGFSVTMHTEKQGKAVKWVTFHVIKTDERIAFDAKLREDDRQPGLFDVRLKTESYEKAKQLAPRWDIYGWNRNGRNGGSGKRAGLPKTPTRRFSASAKSAGRIVRRIRRAVQL